MSSDKKVKLSLKKSNLKKSDVFENDPEAPLGFRIKRVHALQIVHKSKLLLNGSNRIIIVGGSGRGKSTLVLEILPMFSDKTTHVLVCSVKPRDDAFDAIERYCQFSKIKYLKVDNEVDTAGAIEEIVREKKEDDHYVVIFDDLAASNSSSIKDPTNSVIAASFALLRSSNGSLIMVTQSYNNVNTRIRLNSNLKFIFAQDDVFSTRACIEDTIGMFYTGDGAKETRSRIKEIFKSLYDDLHNWILVTSNPPSIRRKWNEIIYPPDLASKEESMIQKKKPFPKQLSERRELLHKAVELGFPEYAVNAPTKVIKEFLETKESKGEVNEEELVDKIFKPSAAKMRTRLMKMIRSYRMRKSPVILMKITELCEKLVESGMMTESKVKYLLRNSGMDRYMEFASVPDGVGDNDLS